MVVIDFSTLLPGPMASLILAEAGADVTKVERPDGEEMRRYDPDWDGVSTNFALLNRGKKSVAVDLKNPVDRDRVIAQIARADVLIEQFRPGVMDRLGLGYAALRALNPRLVYCSITSYGQSGPLSMTAAHDLNFVAETGLLALSSGPVEQPVVPPALIGDIAGGALPAVINILLALEQRRRTGDGCRIDVSMADNLFPFMYWALGKGFGTGQWPGRSDGLETGGTPRYRLYPTSDGQLVAAAPIEQKFWETFCRLIELPPSLADDAADRVGVIERVATIVVSRPASHWRDIFANEECCCSIVRSLEQAVAHPHFHARGLFGHELVSANGAARMPALPVPLDPGLRRPAQSLRAPAVGEHNALFEAPRP
ncbi:CoA transferase [Chelatococcus asaccharovorans]|nr:CoA transferase [Chelatococcus asaccharovorans]